MNQAQETDDTLAGGDDDAALLRVLVDEGLVTASDASRVRALGADGGRAAHLLPQIGAIGETALADALAARHEAPRLTPEIDSVDPDIAARLPVRFMTRTHAAPLFEQDGAVLVAMADPGDLETIHAIGVALQRPVSIRTATLSEIATLLGQLARAPSDDAPEEHGDGVEDDAALLRDKASEAPVIRAADRLLEKAVSERASDIHFDPGRNRSLGVRFRVDGELRSVETPAGIDPAALLSRLKLIGGLDVAERRLPQDGRIKTVVQGEPIDLRIATAPLLHGESMSIRILDKRSAPLELGALGYDETALNQLEGLFSRPDGLILVTGPTGSGKTTTLYAALRQLADGTRKVMSIEDPVEYELGGVSQIQVNPGIGLTFAKALRSILRHDPDVILVGEVRDAETAEICIQAALTGHLVFATLHTRSAASAVSRLIDMGAPSYLISATLAGVVAQRLAKRLGPDGETHGRVAISEILVPDEPIKSLIAEGADTDVIERAARERGMRTLLEDGLAKAERGLIHEAEARRLASGAAI